MLRRTSELMRSVVGGVAVWVVMVVVCWVVFGGAVDAPFFMDDASAVENNRTLESLGGAWSPPVNTGVAGRPVVNFSFALNKWIGGGEPGSYRVFNIVLHSVTAMLVYVIVGRTLRALMRRRQAQQSYVSPPGLDDSADLPRGGRITEPTVGNRGLLTAVLAFFAAVVWAVHPLQTEPVIYITQRTELMVGFFYLATLYAAVRWWAPGSNRAVWWIIATVSCCLGMASKEVMVSVPVVVLLYEWTFIRHEARGSAPFSSGDCEKGDRPRSMRDIFRRSWMLYAGLAVGWGVVIALNWGGPRSETAGFGAGVGAVTWWLTQCKVLWMYLKLAVWPSPLAAHYGFEYLKSLGEAWVWVAGTAGLVVVSGVLLWRRNAAGFVGAWVLLILLPTLVVPIATEMAAERRMYLPLAGIVGMIVIGIFKAINSKFEIRSSNQIPSSKFQWGVTATCAVMGVIAVVLGVASVQRLEVYRNPVVLMRDTVEKQPGDVLARLYFGRVLYEYGDRAGAMEQYEQAIRIDPYYAKAHNDYGLVLAGEGRSAEAMEHYRRAIELEPGVANAYNNLGIELGKAGRFEEAMVEFGRAIELDGELIEARGNMAYTLYRMGRVREAIGYYREAAELARGQGLEEEARGWEESARRLEGGE